MGFSLQCEMTQLRKYLLHPCCHSSAAIVSFIHLLMVGSRKARLALATTRAPAQHAMCGSMSSFQMGVAAGRSYGQAAKVLYFFYSFPKCEI
jgi:hypothetical protein